MNTRTEALYSDNIAQSLYAGSISETFSSVTPERRMKKLPATARIVLEMLDGITTGQIQVTLPDGGLYHCGVGNYGPVVDMVVHEWSVFGDIVGRGDIGAAETFIDGLWGTESLTELLTG